MPGYMPGETPSHGIKFYKLWESATGYTRAFKIHEGRDKTLNPSKCPTDLTRSGEIVWGLVEPLLYGGGTTYIWTMFTPLSYSSMPLDAVTQSHVAP